MRVGILDLIGDWAFSVQDGERLYDLIEPALARGEPVVLDFGGVEHHSAVFFGANVGRLVEADREKRLPDLLRVENLTPLGKDAYDSIVEYALRRRENPRWAAAMDQVIAQWSARD